MPDISEQELTILIDHIEAAREVATAWDAAGRVTDASNTLSPSGPLAKALARLAAAQQHEEELKKMVDKIRQRGRKVL